MQNFLIFVAVLFSIIALVLPRLHSNSEESFNSATALNLLGVTVTGVAFIIGCFFAFKAIEAYRQIRVIEKQIEETMKIKEQFTKELNEFLLTKNEMVAGIVDTINFMHITAGEFLMIVVDPSLNDDDKRKALEKSHLQISRQRGNFFYFKLLPIEERKIALMYIITFGNKSDLEKLEKTISDTTESTDIRKLANDAYSKLLKRLHKEQGNQDSPYHS